MERIFGLSGLLVLPFWALMMVAPRWRITVRLLRSPLVVLGPALLYAALVVPSVGSLLPHMMTPDLATIARLLGTPAGTTIAWAHFLAFDLFVGRWIYLDARERDLSPWLLGPVLFFTLMLGPLGLLGYLVMRSSITRSIKQGAQTLLASARRGSPLLLAVGMGAAVLMAGSLVLMLFDARQVGGVSTWLKPFKFAVSVVVMAPTLAALVAQLPPSSRGLRRASVIFAVTLGVELVLITTQAARAVPSHFNFTTPLDGAIFQIMAVAITAFWVTQAWLTVKAFRHRFVDSALGWGIRLGLLLSTLGAGLAFTMTARPTPAQAQALADGRPTMRGAHAVGVEDGGAGLPITRWSTRGGDLRIPHFLGLHALQVLPLFGWAVSRRRRAPGKGDAARAGVVVAAGVAYLGLVVTTLVQALRGQPLHGPDAVTLAVAVAGAMVSMAIWGLSRRPRGPALRAAIVRS